MDISKMTQTEKSESLAIAAGWLRWSQIYRSYLQTSIAPTDYREGNLYARENMSLAWRIRAWALNQNEDWEYELEDMRDYMGLDSKLPQAAQYVWLDKVLELITEDEPATRELAVSEMTEEEKSVLLLRLIGRKPLQTQYGDPDLWLDSSGEVHAVNIYKPVNMQIAWEVSNWTHNTENFPYPSWNEFDEWWREAYIHASSAYDAQRLWLDKILTLAVEAGVIDPAEGSDG